MTFASDIKSVIYTTVRLPRANFGPIEDSRGQRHKYPAIRSMYNHSAKGSNPPLSSFRSRGFLIGSTFGEVAFMFCKNAAIDRRVTLNHFTVERSQTHRFRQWLHCI